MTDQVTGAEGMAQEVVNHAELDAKKELSDSNNHLWWLPEFSDLILADNNVALVSVPNNYESSKLTLPTVDNAPKVELSMPFVVASVGAGVVGIKRGDLVYPSNDIIHSSSHLAFDLAKRWKNVIIASEYLIKLGAILDSESATYNTIIMLYEERIHLVEEKMAEEAKTMAEVAAKRKQDPSTIKVKDAINVYENLR